MLCNRGIQKTKNCIFWLAKYKVFDMCDFLAMLLKGKGPLLPSSPLPADCHVCKWLDQL